MINLPRCLGLTLTVLWLAAGVGYSKPKPNVLFISVDDLNDWIEPLSSGRSEG